MQALGYAEGSGPELFNELASELAENSVEISSASAKRLYNALQSGFEGKGFAGELEQLHLLESLKPNNEPAASDELVASRVTLDESRGICPRTRAQLRLINLDADQKRKLQDGLIYLSGTSYEEFHKKSGEHGEEEIRRFGEWLG